MKYNVRRCRDAGLTLLRTWAVRPEREKLVSAFAFDVHDSCYLQARYIAFIFVGRDEGTTAGLEKRGV